HRRIPAGIEGQMDLLVNNAGIAIPQPPLDTTTEAFDSTMAVNVRTGMNVWQRVARQTVNFNCRRIVWIISLALTLTASISSAEVRLASIFGDHMVLQQQS